MIEAPNSPPWSIWEISASSQSERRLLVDALILEIVATGLWRICDSRVASKGLGRILGFVEIRDGRFEVMQSSDRFVWTSFPTMAAAIDHVARTYRDVNPARARGTLAWMG